MTQRSLAVLAILNAVLLAAIAMTFGPGTSEVQAQGLGRGGEYLMIAGNSQQREQQAVIYVMEANSGRVAAFMVNSANRNVTVIGGRNVGEDISDEGDDR